MKLGIGRAVGVLAIASMGVGATCAQAKSDAKWVIDQTQAACVIANVLLPTATVASICKVDAVLVPWLDVVLSTNRTVLSKVRGESCAPVLTPDAGTEGGAR